MPEYGQVGGRGRFCQQTKKNQGNNVQGLFRTPTQEQQEMRPEWRQATCNMSMSQPGDRTSTRTRMRTGKKTAYSVGLVSMQSVSQDSREQG